ncbi:hypothetical protein ERO13_D07G085600v2 [Gossypium hirsutum]|uniref:Uncharacterized protein n=2 Tax=Gossypium TaxID=3633 RepID=A0A5J5QQA2_GOSBA|nr:hypothetical protein ES319_D07G089900v1 [Gossypium barbadense]KAG4137664.1 hypothetical protein ERO13_D07G085600v2 [Gossypium hirsutum]TYI72915.1 hypothetical protein E1A91_D07G093100v1 [Gossypium mustelinum]
MKKICLFLAILVLVFCNSMATSIETNSTVSVIADFDDLEFLMDSHFGRVLQSSGSVSRKSLNAGQAAANCGRGRSYDSCLPNPNRPITPQNCGTYSRACGR